MSADNAADPDPTIFSVVITPHRSLGRAGFLVLMGVFGVASFATGMMFFMAGAWPVFGFCGLDVLLLYFAFRLNYRHADAYEEVHLTPSQLRVRKVTHRGRVREWMLNPLWVRLEKIAVEDYGISRLLLISRGKQLVIGGFLAPEERESFARAFCEALNQVRRGVFQNSAG
jgi:uncharacterized membrane protein